MTIRNAIIAPVVRITPPVTKRGVDMIKEASAEGFMIEFEGKQVARLLPDERAAGVLEILEDLRKIGIPVYVDVHPESKAIKQLLIPIVGKVTKISDAKDDDMYVDLEISSARQKLNHSNPEFEEILKSLRAAMEHNMLMIVTVTDNHEIIDVRPFPEEFKPPTLPPPPQPLPTLPRKKFRFWRWFCCAHAITNRQALIIFNMISTKTCDPLAVPPPCIPFLYPDDGCWGRAHEMYRLMLLGGVVSKKLWIFGNLQVHTKNHPSCQVFWGWHVAPIVCVKGSGWLGWLWRQEKVFDPSLFSEPVSKSKWKSVQGDSNAQLVGTGGPIFYHSYSGYNETDPNFTKTAQVLSIYRLQLKNRSLQIGPPPYSNCP